MGVRPIRALLLVLPIATGGVACTVGTEPAVELDEAGRSDDHTNATRYTNEELPDDMLLVRSRFSILTLADEGWFALKYRGAWDTFYYGWWEQPGDRVTLHATRMLTSGFNDCVATSSEVTWTFLDGWFSDSWVTDDEVADVDTKRVTITEKPTCVQ